MIKWNKYMIELCAVYSKGRSHIYKSRMDRAKKAWKHEGHYGQNLQGERRTEHDMAREFTESSSHF